VLSGCSGLGIQIQTEGCCRVWVVQAQQLVRVRQLVLHALAAGLSAGPQLEVLRPVVRARAVAVMNALPRDQRTVQQDRHDEPVLKRVGAAAREVAEALRDDDAPVAVRDPAVRAGRAHGLIGRRVPERPDPPQVCTAQPAAVLRAVAVPDAARRPVAPAQGLVRPHVTVRDQRR
jgi:hypothetical protein